MSARGNSGSQQIWKEALRHAALHPWTILPLTLGALANAGVIAAQFQPEFPWLAYCWPFSGIMAAVAAINTIRILNRTDNYVRGRKPRPHFITPTDREREWDARLAQPDGMRVMAERNEPFVCKVCQKTTRRVMELKRTQPSGRTDFRTFGMHEECQNTAEGQANIAAENLLARNTTGRFTPPGLIEQTMEQARRDFQDGATT